MDLKVVNWSDFHLLYLELISKHRGTNKNNVVLRSHDQVDDLEVLSDWLMKENPGFVADGSIPKKKLIAELYRHTLGQVLAGYQQLHSQWGDFDLPTKVRHILTNPFEHTYLKKWKTMYYLAGAVMKIISNVSCRRRKSVFSSSLENIQKNALTSKEGARHDCLSPANVEAKEIVNLCYVNELFLNLVLKIESVFHTLLSGDSIAVYGIRIVADNDSAIALGIGDFGFTNSSSQPQDDDVKVEIIR